MWGGGEKRYQSRPPIPHPQAASAGPARSTWAGVVARSSAADYEPHLYTVVGGELRLS